MIARERTSKSRFLSSVAGGAAAALALTVSSPASANHAGVCSSTSRVGSQACRAEAGDDYYVALAICKNMADAEARSGCIVDARSDLGDAREECGEVYDEREEVCDAIGQAAYDPQIDPDDFVEDYDDQNPYFPIAVGNRWVYEGGDELITVTVKDEIKLIQDVECIVVHDIVEEDGSVIEDTDDWYGVHKNGDVRYFGEISQNFEEVEGDDPETPELVDIDGSWKADRDGAKSGIVTFKTPEVGKTYRQEWSFGDAEDMAEVLSDDYDFSDGGDLNALVPQALAELMCDHDCVVTREWSPLEPGVSEIKYFAKGIGFILETNPDTGEALQIVECNLDDSRCDDL